jgi:NTE family protein
VNKRDVGPLPDEGTHRPSRPSLATEFGSVALVLQGGGALGAYQAGVYERLLEAGVEPTWVAGISIGAINSAIIAGNARETGSRGCANSGNWSAASDAGAPASCWTGLPLVDTRGPGSTSWRPAACSRRACPASSNRACRRRTLLPASGATSYYDTAPLRATLERLVDFDRINARETRLSVGAVNVRTGNFAYFDNATDASGPSTSWPAARCRPASMRSRSTASSYWDGGMVSNTPLEWVLSRAPGSTPWSSRSTCGAPTASCRATSPAWPRA